MSSQFQRSSLTSACKSWSVAIALCTAGFTGLGMVTLPPSVLAHSDRQSQTRDHEPMEHTVTVTGQGSEKIASTLAQVQLGVEVQGKTAQEVQQEAARRSSAVVAFLKSRSVEKLQTTGINLSPQYRYDNGKQTLTGYQANNSVSFRVPIAQSGAIMDEAIKVGASRIDGISFAASDQAIADAQKVALRKATQEAQAQAQAVLSALGLSPKEVVRIQINGANAPQPIPPMPMGAMVMKTMDQASTPVVGGEQSVDASVTLQISY